MMVRIEIWLTKNNEYHITTGVVNGTNIGEYKFGYGFLIDIYEKEFNTEVVDNYIERAIRICKGELKSDKYILENSFKIVDNRFFELDTLVKECVAKNINLEKLCSGLMAEHKELKEILNKKPPKMEGLQ